MRSGSNVRPHQWTRSTPALGGQTWYLPFTRAAVPEVKIAEGLVLADPPLMVGEPEGSAEADEP